ncbi:putative NOP5 family protein [uncultured archaeon]|nr:putative NOP5 family protein [uncultured archaeon]
MAFKFDQSKFMFRAKRDVTQAMASPDLVLVQVVAAIDDLNKISNLMSERLTEWYALHFPEFKHAEPLKYAQVVMAFDRSNPNQAALAAIVGEEAAQTLSGKANRSLGVVFSPEDIQAVREQAGTLISLYAYRDTLNTYTDSLAQRIAPNLSHIAGPSLAAKLIAQAGSLSKLSSFPASTIQVLGAEKALFKHLKSGSPPPKHGLIFQHASISTAPKWVRGKIARALAAKLCIAAKADAISHHFIAEKLKEQFEARAAMLRQKPMPAKKAVAPQTGGNFGSGPRPFQSGSGSFGGSREGSGPRPSFGGPKPYSSYKGGSHHERPRPYSGQWPQSGEKKPFGGSREGGERRSFGGSREGGSFNRPRPGSDRPRPPFGGNREGGSREGGERPRSSFGGSREGGFKSKFGKKKKFRN